MFLIGLRKKSLTVLMIVTVLTGLISPLSPLSSLTVLAQAEPAFVRQVRAIETSDLGIPYPAGLAFSPGARAFYVLEARNQAQTPPPNLDILKVTPYEDRGASARITAAIRDPINVAYDPTRSRLLIFQAAPDKLIEVQEGPEGNLDPATLVRHDARHFGLQNPQGMALDPASGHLFVLDASGPRIVRIEPDAHGGFAGAVISEIDLSQAGLPAVRGLTLDSNSGHFHLFSPSEQRLHEVTALGEIVATRDLSGLGLVDPQGLVLAPSADLTDDPGQMSLYIADSGPFSEQTPESGALESTQDAGVGTVAQPPGNITELSFTKLAALDAADWTALLVQTIDASTWNPPGPDPSGLAYLPASSTLLISDGEVEETVGGTTHFDGANVWETTLSGSVVGTANISKEPPTVVPMSDEPTGVAWNPANGHFYFSDDSAREVFDLNPGVDETVGTADDTWTSFDTRAHGSEDPEGVAYDSVNNRLFVADGVNTEIYEYTLSGTLVSQFDVGTYGIEDPESVEFNPVNGTLFILSGKGSVSAAIETTTSGVLIQTIDISAANSRSPAGLAYAPASNGSGEMRFYIVDRGIDNNNDPDIIDGKMYEMTMPPVGPVAPSANDDSGSTIENTAVTIDVVANDSDPNGNLDPASTNTTCANGSSGCSDVSNGSLANHGDGSFTYTPDTGYLGSDGFVYEICDTDNLCDTASVSINVGGATVEVRVLASSDDAEENSNGFVALTSSDLELVVTSNTQTVGMRFNGVTIPQGANITNAYVQFQADEAHSGATSLTIEGEAVDNAATFVAGSGGDVSSRPRTTTSVPWSPAPWTMVGAAGLDQQTPNIAPVIQQIVNRFGWASGNSLAVIITGTGTRTAEAYDGVSAAAPLLHVEYRAGSGNSPPAAADDGYSTGEDTLLSVAAPGVLDNDSDGDGDALTASLVSDVTNGSLTLNANGSFSYTPNGDYYGPDSFAYRANDGSIDSNVATVSITVNAANDAPVAVDDGYSADEDTPLSVVAPGVLGNDTDADGDPLTAGLVSDVSNGSLVLNADGSFTYTPDGDYHGPDSFTYRANDGSVDSNVVTVSIAVNAVNDAPVAVDEGYTMQEDTPLSVAAPGVLDNDTDVDGDPLTASLVSDVSSGSLALNANGSFTYTPDGDYTGTDSFTYRANDGSIDSNVATVSITVNAVNDAPVAADEAYTTQEDIQVSVGAPGVLGNDTDADGDPLTAILVSDVGNGVLTLNPDGSFIYNPNSGFVGGDGFTYQANDGGADSNIATVTITVHPVNDAPVAVDDGYSTDEDTPLSVAAQGVLANDTDGDGDALTAILVSGVSNGSLTLNDDGSFSYTPDGDFSGTDSFVYRANDGWVDSNQATVTITVNPIADAPVAVDDGYSTDEDTPLSVAAPGVLGNDSDADGDPLTASLVGDVSYGVLGLNADGSFTYNPNPGFSGSDSFTYRANDGSADSNLATVSIAVSAVNDAPVAVDDGYSTDEDTPLSVAAQGVLANDTDGDGDGLTAVLVSDVSNGSLALNADGSFDYTPNANYSGPDSFTYRANDGLADSNEATVSLTVNSVNDAPVAADDGYTTVVDTQLSVVAPGLLGNDTDADGDALDAILVSDVSNGSLALNADGSLTYNPGAGFVGSDSFTYRATDGSVDSNIATVTLTVSPLAPTTFEVRVGASEDDAEERATGRVSFTSSDLELVFDRDVQTIGLRFNGVTIPQGATITDAYVQFEADEVHSEATALTIQAEATDDAVTFDNVTNNISNRPRTTAAAFWSPSAWVSKGDAGPDQRTPPLELVPVIQEVVNRGGWSSGNSLAIIITGTGRRTATAYNGDPTGAPLLHVEYLGGLPSAPVAVDDGYSTEVNTQLVVAIPGVLGNDTDADGDALTASLMTGVSNGSLALNTDGSFTYSPNPGFVGSDSFTYKANDGGADSNDATVTITVHQANEAPVAGDDGYSTNEDTVLSVAAPGVLGNDTDGDGNPLTAILVSDVGNGSLALNADGSFSYTPSPNYSGPDSFTYRANDGLADSGVATVSITVSAVNDAPLAVDDGYSTVVDTQLSVAAPGLLGNDSDADGDGLTAILVDNVTSGSLTLNGDGSFSYDPNPGYTGNDSFTYKANDGSVDSNVVTVSITVNPSAPVTVEVRVGTSSDDAEERASGRVRLTSSDLELVLDKDDQTVGVRFAGVTIPHGATITNAYVQFQANEVHSDPTTVMIQGEAIDDAASFANTANNITNRSRTTAGIPWSPPPWTIKDQVGDAQQTPDLTAVIQEVVDRQAVGGETGWVSGNALVIIISGTGKRVATAWDGDPAGAPLLHVEYY